MRGVLLGRVTVVYGLRLVLRLQRQGEAESWQGEKREQSGGGREERVGCYWVT